MNWIKARAAEITSKLGAFLALAGPLLQQYAQFDVKFAYASAAAGIVMILIKETPSAPAA